MNTIAYDRSEPGLEPFEEEPGGERVPRRPRRNFFNRRSAALVAILTCAAGFYAGVRVEKGQIASTPQTLGAVGATGATARTAASRAGSAGAAGATGATGATASRAAIAGAGGGPGAGGGTASFGTVSTVDGKTLVVTEASGNTVKVKLASSTKITKSQSVARSAIHPGDTVVIAGAPNSSGTLVAATISDSGVGRAGGFGGFGGFAGGGGAGAGGSTTGASASGRSASGSGSAVGSLFSGSGGG